MQNLWFWHNATEKCYAVLSESAWPDLDPVQQDCVLQVEKREQTLHSADSQAFFCVRAIRSCI